MRPPLSNLGPMSEPWGRFITEQTLTNAEGIERLGGDAANDGRINNSALDLMASQINELYQRQSAIVTSPDLQTPPFDNTGVTFSASVNIQLPRPTDAARTGWVALNCNPTVEPALFTAVFVTFSIDGRMFYRSSMGLPPSDSAPVGWNNASFSGATGFDASPSSGGVLRVLLEAYGSPFGDPGLRTASLRNISATVAYGQRG